MSAAAKATNVTSINAGTASNREPEPAPAPEEKKTRSRSVVQQAATLASAIEKADKAIADESLRHAERMAELEAKKAALIDGASDEVLKKAQSLLIG